MIVSHEHRFIFIKTRKTAGTSIEVYLAQHLGGDAIVTPVAPPIDGHEARNYSSPPRSASFGSRHTKAGRRAIERERWFYNHIPARIAKDRLGRKVWNSYFKFTFERNSWDKTVSYYYFRTAGDEQPPSFEEWATDAELPTDWDAYTLADSLAVDFVGQYSSLEADLGAALANTTWSTPVTLGREKAASRPRDSNASTLFDPETSALVATVFAREIETWGYLPPTIG